MREFKTPMMRQYARIKRKYPDCLLFFRLGDFYELFLEDAKIGAEIMGITLTRRNKGKDGDIPMAGVPYHAADAYLAKLVKAGHKVAICEQVGSTDGSGIVDREVVRVVTPGTVLDEKSLESKENNFLVSITTDGKKKLGYAFADLSTGDFQANQLDTSDFKQALSNELTKINPTEAILPEKLYNDPLILKTLREQKDLNIYCFYEWDVFTANAHELLVNHFGVQTLRGFGLAGWDEAIKASAALLGYLKQTQKDRVKHLQHPHTVDQKEYLALDRSTIINLELFATLREGEKKGTLIDLLDNTRTAMGGRMLRAWLRRPLLSRKRIEGRLAAVEAFAKNVSSTADLRENMEGIADVERILSRLAVGTGNARDLVGLKTSLQKILKVKEKLNGFESELIRSIHDNLDSQIEVVIKAIEDQIVEEPRVELKQGGLIKSGVSDELDKLRQSITGSKEWLSSLEKKERERTGIGSLKVGFNKVFGYYIEVSKPNLKLVPENYVRKQTLANAERFITPELKEKEEIVLTAEEKINELEYQIFLEVVERVLREVQVLQRSARAVATLDCLLSFAELARRENYVKPQIVESGEIKIKDGRHPVVERLLEDGQFVPNDTELNNKNQQLLIVTGPNMAGKSVYLRQVALITLMSQMGSFVPAKEATISVVDRIFVRSGASDMITSGLSTFMVEMVETANILNHATKNSLVVLDEIGRGTSTYDGVSIAWAVAEYLVSHPKTSPKTLFATHYHELQTLAEQYSKIKNYQMAVKESSKGEPIFLHKVVEGGASHSYGIEVAKLAGVPKDVVYRAVEVLGKLEEREVDAPRKKIAVAPQEQVEFLSREESEIIEELKNLDPEKLTPLEALSKLAELKGKI